MYPEMNEAQKAALNKLIERWGREPDQITGAFFDHVIMVRYEGLWIGIETDGHAHS